MINDFQRFIASLEVKLAGPLPGISSQLKMAGMKRKIEAGQIVVPNDARRAGVMVLFYPVEENPNIAFIKRNEYPGVHGGQISFPGGGWESHDKNMTETALRETEEEIGVPAEKIIPIGNLSSLYIPPSNFLVTPTVGYTTERPEFRPDPEEVEKILEIPFHLFLDSNNLTEKDIIVSMDVVIKVPCFSVNGYVIWGATAMMLHELTDVISRES
jgi:8-oxo-dGTP pyrophosphatase MutT (NUDIX family)